ncbi:MAG: ABC transporter substrate-binding protein [Chloroflexota bacterium]|nr:ABC transporter substrate-binding protein [Chloroflexota bacterium]
MTHRSTTRRSAALTRRWLLQTAAATGVAGSGLTAATATASPSPASSAPSRAQEGGSQVVIGAWAEPATLLSGAPVTGASYQQIQRIIANGLVKLGYPSFEVEPDLAETWEVSEDSLVHTFTLRSGVTWHDGEPFTADDVKFTYDHVTNAEWPGGLDSYFAQIAGATEHKAGEADQLTGVEVIDETHVRITLLQPDALFLASAASRQRILPRHILESIAVAEIDRSDFARKPVYTGAYIVEEWLQGESLTLRANPDYFGGAPAIETVISRFIPDPATAYAELTSGGLDIGTVSPDLLEAFTSDPAFTVRELPGLRVIFLNFDLNLPIFSDPRVRQAISHSVDKQTVIDALLLGKGEVGRSLITPLSWIFNPDAPDYPYDPERAASLLDEAGWTMGDDGVRANANGERLAFTLTVPTAWRQDGLAVQPFLQEAGFEVTIEEQGAGQVTGPLLVGEFEATVNAWNNFIIDPRADLQRWFQNPRPNDSTGYVNEEVDALFVEARAALDQEVEKSLYFEIQNLVGADAPLVYLWRQQDLLVVGPRLTVPETETLSELYDRIPEWQING